MAATKSILSMRQWAYMELGDESLVKFVAMATPEDLKANAEFVRLADSFVEVPAGKNSNNYANVDIIVKVRRSKARRANFVSFCFAAWLQSSVSLTSLAFAFPSLQIAQEQGVDAVWPGWGHASENPNLPNSLNKIGIKFIGPTGPVMR